MHHHDHQEDYDDTIPILSNVAIMEIFAPECVFTESDQIYQTIISGDERVEVAIDAEALNGDHMIVTKSSTLKVCFPPDDRLLEERSITPIQHHHIQEEESSMENIKSSKRPMMYIAFSIFCLLLISFYITIYFFLVVR